MSVKENIFSLRQDIKVLCQKISKNPAEITVLAVTKRVDIELIKEAIAEGIVDIAENKVQEAVKKYFLMRNTECGMRNIKWHMIGHLQSNKVKDAVKIFDLIHSVDSLRLAEEINKQSEEINKIQDVLIEVNVSGEKTKFGLKPEELIDVINKAKGLKNINIKGLMTMAPFSDNPEKSRPYFKMLRELKEKIVIKFGIGNWELVILSMGMSQDYQVAIGEGATMVRIGSAIFKK